MVNFIRRPIIRVRISFGTAVYILFCLVFFPFHTARAYLDPGTGSYAIQAVIGVVLGGTYAAKGFIGLMFQRVKHWFKKRG